MLFPSTHGEASSPRIRNAMLFLLLNLTTSIEAELDAGFNVYSAAQVAISHSSHSWEWGTTTEALLELYNNELSVFGPNPFPNNQIPTIPTPSSVFALRYAQPFILRNSQTLVNDAAVGDPASLGVAAILLGTSDQAYISAANRQAEYLLTGVPRWTNGAISHRPDVAELWADNMAMAFPFLAYLAVQQNNVSLMAEVVRQCGLYRDVLKPAQFFNWAHIIGPQSQDTGLWSTGNGWASFGMVRILHTLQKWGPSSSLTTQVTQLKTWIKEILDGALLSGFESGLLRNYLNDESWFGEMAGTALLSAVAYRMATDDPGMFPQKYVDWADTNRIALGHWQGSDGVVVPAVNPYNWLSRNKYYGGSPEGQAFMVYLYTAYRDCVGAGTCKNTAAVPASTVSHEGIGPIDILTVLAHAVTFSTMPPQPTFSCPQSVPVCDVPNCSGQFNGIGQPVCTTSLWLDCPCTPNGNTCGPPQDCELHNCVGVFDLSNGKAYCSNYFRTCECLAVEKTCGVKQSCEAGHCDGVFDLTNGKAYCSNFFKGCECLPVEKTCGTKQSCEAGHCDGVFDLTNGKAYCSNFFKTCECQAVGETCGTPQPCENGQCSGVFDLSNGKAYCSNFFAGCECQAVPKTCGTPQPCENGNCDGHFDINDGKAYCWNFFKGCECAATPTTCGRPQDCETNFCAGSFDADGKATCKGKFKGCACKSTPTTCGIPQPCDRNSCDGTYNIDGSATCKNHFAGCVCQPVPKTCGNAAPCEDYGCAGTFNSNGIGAVCRGNFAGCGCLATQKTCGDPQACNINSCAGTIDSNGLATCKNHFAGCQCIRPVTVPCAVLLTCAITNNCNGVAPAGSYIGQCQGPNVGCPCYSPLPPAPPPPPPPPKITVNIGLMTSASYDPELGSYEQWIVWDSGIGICDGWTLGMTVFRPCDWTFCLGGVCGLKLDGCENDNNFYIRKDGEFYASCHTPTRYSSETCRAGIFFGYADQLLECSG